MASCRDRCGEEGEKPTSDGYTKKWFGRIVSSPRVPLSIWAFATIQIGRCQKLTANESKRSKRSEGRGGSPRPTANGGKREGKEGTLALVGVWSTVPTDR